MSISTRIQAIEQHLTDDYNVLEVAGADLTNVDKNILNLKATWQERLLYFMNNGTQQVWDNWDKVNGTGETLTLNNTEEAPMKIVLKGNTSQEGTPTPETPQDIHVVSGDNSIEVKGKNFIPFTNQDFTKNNVRYYVQNGSLYLNGTSTGETSSTSTEFKNNFSFTLQPGTYRFSWKTISGISVFVRKYEGNDILAQLTSNILNAGFTLTEQTQVYIGFYVYQATTNNNNIESMIEKGSNATTYEAYTGESYPISLGVENLAKVDYNFNQTTNGINCKVNSNGTISLSGTATATTTFVLSNNLGYSNGAYTMQCNGIPTDSDKVRIRFRNSNGSYSEGDVNNTAELTYNITKRAFPNRNVNQFDVWVASGAVLDCTLEVQLEKGTKYSGFTPYGTTPIELCKIGDYQDKIDKSSGKNLFNSINWRRTASGGGFPAASDNYSTIVSSNNNNIVFTATGDYGGVESDFFPVKNGETYTISFLRQGTLPNRFFITQYDNTKTRVSTLNYTTVATVSNTTFTTTREGYIAIGFNNTTSSSSNFTINNIMLNEGTTALEYEPYGTRWYVKKEIGKVVLDGSESWFQNGTYPNVYGIDSFLTDATTTETRPMLSSAFTYGGLITNGSGEVQINKFYQWIGMPQRLILGYNSTSLADFKTWMGNNNVEVIYPLKTPTYTEITDSTLLSQLNALAKSYEGQTNISQESNDLASILNAIALREMA